MVVDLARRLEGFTLIELMIVILIIGILAAVAVPSFLGYVRDARLAEGKALAGSALSALQICAQRRGTAVVCTLPDVASRIGVDTVGVSGDGRWTVDPSSTMQLNDNATYTGTVWVRGSGTNEPIATAIFARATAGVFLRCNLDGTTLPAEDGPPC